jgi:hypothetical protein
MNSGCTFARKLGFGLFELRQAGHQMLHVRRADIRAVGVAEIDDAKFAIKFAMAALLAILIGQSERAADCGTRKRRLR